MRGRAEEREDVSTGEMIWFEMEIRRSRKNLKFLRYAWACELTGFVKNIPRIRQSSTVRRYSFPLFYPSLIRISHMKKIARAVFQESMQHTHRPKRNATQRPHFRQGSRMFSARQKKMSMG